MKSLRSIAGFFMQREIEAKSPLGTTYSTTTLHHNHRLLGIDFSLLHFCNAYRERRRD
jgi:hypothetical protein